MNKWEADPSLFAEMSKPFKSAEAANESLEGFTKELTELRKKYKITTMLWTIHVTAMNEEGQEGDCMICSGFGDQSKHESMAAYCYGRESQARQERMMSLVSQGIKAVKKER